MTIKSFSRFALGAFFALALPFQTSLAQTTPTPSGTKSYEAWLAELKKEALAFGISQPTLDKAFEGVEPKPRVVALDRKQPETVETLDTYLKARITRQRIEAGRKKYEENKKLLQKIEAKYHVQGRFLVAFWGMETSYGAFTGGNYVIEALTTLAYDGRRAAFFRKQLLDALTILEQGHITPDKMTGSWAGAMGHTQFMPSTFRKYAIDGDGDGKINLWQSEADALTSAANYLSSIGWNIDETWGREVKLPKNFDRTLIDTKAQKALTEWHLLGVKKPSGDSLPDKDIQAMIVQPDGPKGRAFIVYPANYNAIMDWNRSHKFAIAIGTLADAIGK